MGERIGAWRIVALAFSMLFFLVCSFLISAPASAATGDLVDTVTYVSVMQKNASITVQPFYEGETFPTVKDSPCSEDPKGYNKEWCSTHKFLGWSLAAGSKNVNYKAGQTVDAALLGNTVYAVWSHPVFYMVWYDSNGAGAAPSASICGGDESCEVTLNSGKSLHREGYVFAGGNTKSDGSGESFSRDQKVTLTQNYRLYAQWTEFSPVDPGATNPPETTNPDETDTGSQTPSETPNNSGNSSGNESAANNGSPDAGTDLDKKSQSSANSEKRVVVLPEGVVPGDSAESGDDSSAEEESHGADSEDSHEGDSENDETSEEGDPYSKIQVQGEAAAQSEDSSGKFSRNADALVGIASVLFFGVAVAFFPFGSASSAAGGSKASLGSKLLKLLRR